MTRDHKLILGGAGLGISGCTFALGAWALALALLVAGVVLIMGAGR
jgi:hypothetical protein